MVSTEWIRIPVKYLIKYSGTPSKAPIKNQAFTEQTEGLFPAYSASGQDVWLPNYMFNCEAIVLSAVGARCGKTFLAKGKFGVCANTHVLVLNGKCDGRFLNYLLNNEEWWQKGGSAQPFVKVQESINQRINLPSKEEQKYIADFLDTKCEEIDGLIHNISKQVDQLTSYKKAVIYKALTGGLSNKNILDTSDGVWKTIPESWSLVDIKYLFEIVKRIAGKEGYDVLSVTQSGLKVKDITSGEGQLADDYSKYQLVYPTDYVMNHMDLLTGWVDLSDKTGVTSPDYRVFRLRDKKNNSLEYFKYVMQCCYMNRIFYSLGQGVSNLGRWRLQTSAFNNFKIPVPPLNEQNDIVRRLTEIISDTDRSIELKEKQLEKIVDYKKSIIYEYTTGKKRVKGEL